MYQVSKVDCLFLAVVFQVNKQSNKQDEPWMKPFISQFNNMNFSVSTFYKCFVCFKYLTLLYGSLIE